LAALGDAATAGCDDIWLLRFVLSFPEHDKRGALLARRHALRGAASLAP